MLTGSISNQAMHRSTSFRALVLFGVVALVTAFYQSITPHSSALAIPTGLTPRQRVQTGPVTFDSDARLPAPSVGPSLSHLICGPSILASALLAIPLLATPLLAIPLLACRSYSSGTAEVATKAVASWSNVLDAPNEDQCGLFDVGAPTNDQCGPLDAPNDNQCAPNEPIVASPEASATVRRNHSRHCPGCSP